MAALTRDIRGVNARRYGVMIVSFVLGVGSLLSLYALAWESLPSLRLRDVMTLISVTIASLGHLAITAVVATGRRQWPLRHDDARSILGFVGWLSVVLAFIGATQLLGIRVVRGVTVSNVFEFALAVVFFSLPGWTLLTLRMLTFRPDRSLSDPHRFDHRATGAPFVIESMDSFIPERISQSWSTDPRPTTPTIEATINRLWEAEAAVAAEQGRHLYDGTLVRVQSIRVTGGTLSFLFGPTTYREFFGTNLFGASEAAVAGEACMANPLGVSAVVSTRDGFLVVGRRSDRVAFHAGYVHTIGGMLDEQDRAANGQFDLFGCIRRETCEELGLTPAQVGDVRQIGLVKDTAIHQPELLFDVSVADSRAELEDRFVPSLSGGEHSELLFVRDDPESVAAFLRQVDQMAPVAQAAVLLHGRRLWGIGWYERLCTALFSQVPKNECTP